MKHGAGEFRALEWSERNLLIVMRIAAFDGGQARVGPAEGYLEAMGAPRDREVRGLWFRARKSPPWMHWPPESTEVASEFLELHADRRDHAKRLAGHLKKMHARRKAGERLPVVVMHPRSVDEPDITEGSAFWVARVKGDELMFPSRLLLADFRRDIMSRSSGVVDVEALARKSVSVVGLGAVGSVAAVALAKAGVGRFHLFDHQKVEPGNVSRHACDLRDIGRPKVDAVGDLIIRRNPEAVVTPCEANIMSEENIDRLAGSMEHSDIVLIATGDRESAGLVNQLSLDVGVEAVYASVLAGARGGEVFRVTPFRTSCFQCIQRYKAGDPRREAVADYDRTKGPAAPSDGCGAVFMPGTGIDTETVALAQARLALQTLLRNTPGSTYRDEVCDYLLIGSTKGAPFDDTYHVIKDDAYRERLQDCEQCGSLKNSPNEEDERLLGKILEEAEGE